MSVKEKTTECELGRERAGSAADRKSDSEIDLLSIAITVARYKRTWLTFTLTCTVLAVVISFILPKAYTASTTILPPQQSQSTANVLMGQIGALAGMSGKDLGLKNPGDLYAAMLKTERIEDALVRRFDLQRVYHARKLIDARKTLESRTSVTSRKEGLITISVEDRDPKRASDLANAYSEELSKLNQDLAVTEASQRRLFFEKQLQTAKESLADAEVALKRTQEKTGLIQMDAQAKAIIESVANVKAQVAAKEVEIQAMRSFATEHNPALIMAEQQLAGLRAQLARLEYQQNRQGDIQLPTANVPGAGLEYVRRVRDVKYHETIFELLAKQFEAAKLDEVKNSGVVQVVDPATIPERRSSPKRPLIVLFAAFASAMLSIMYVVLRETLSEVFAYPHQQARLALLKSYLRVSRSNP